MNIKTKSGFSCEINEKKVGSWNTVDLYSKISEASRKGNLGDLIELTKALYVFVLGDDGYKALMDFVKDDDGIVSAEDMAREFNAIMDAANAKKSRPSQA